MALKPDRQVIEYDISKFMLNITSGGERGGVVVATGATVPSGAAMDQTVSYVAYSAKASGAIPMGLLLADVVNVDLTRQILNPYKSEAQVGDKVPLMVKGWAVTNSVSLTGSDGGAVSVGESAYLIGSGFLSTDSTVPNSAATAPLVGKFLTAADEDGYYKVRIDL